MRSGTRTERLCWGSLIILQSANLGTKILSEGPKLVFCHSLFSLFPNGAEWRMVNPILGWRRSPSYPDLGLFIEVCGPWRAGFSMCLLPACAPPVPFYFSIFVVSALSRIGTAGAANSCTRSYGPVYVHSSGYGRILYSVRSTLYRVF